jgi:hypothetical protein
MPYHLEPFFTDHVGDVFLSSRKKIVETNNVMALGQQSLAEMRADKTGTAGN